MDRWRRSVERELHWESCWNVRDLGGYPTAVGKKTRWRTIVRAGNLSKLTEVGRDALVSYGIRTVIDLRDPREFDANLDPFHERGPWAGSLRYVNAPFISDGEFEALRGPEKLVSQGYVVALDHYRQNIARAISAVAAAPPGGVVIHCHAGKERTGVIAALLLAIAGVPDEVIADDYVISDRYLAALYERVAAREENLDERARILQNCRSEPAHMLVALEHLRSVGGVEAYLAAAGTTAEEIATLQLRLSAER
jgi:protein tyrosine/serine phosphatase